MSPANSVTALNSRRPRRKTPRPMHCLNQCSSGHSRAASGSLLSAYRGCVTYACIVHGDPLRLVLSAGSGKVTDRPAKQEAVAALSTNSSHRAIDGDTHASLLADEAAAASFQAILNVLTSFRTVFRWYEALWSARRSAGIHRGSDRVVEARR